jgi:hypothetical protein
MLQVREWEPFDKRMDTAESPRLRSRPQDATSESLV